MISSACRSSLPAIARSHRLRAPPCTCVSRIKAKPSTQGPQIASSTQRQFTQSTRLAYPRKDSQDKDSINTEATEYSKSATDDESARHEDAAFNPNVTDPQKQKSVAGKGTGGSTVSKRDVGLCFI